MKRQAFTLIEILVVVAIIAVLIGILMPSLAAARQQAKLTKCAANLHMVGVAMIAYMHDSKDRMPYVSRMPSVTPWPLKDANGNDRTDNPIYLADVLRKHMPTGNSPATVPLTTDGKVRLMSGTGGAFECPNDRPNFNVREGDNAGLSFYQTEKCSYEPRTDLNGVTPTEFSQNLHRHFDFWRRQQDANVNLPVNSIWFARDYYNFHGNDPGGQYKARVTPARRYVYIDGHVGDYEN